MEKSSDPAITSAMQSSKKSPATAFGTSAAVASTQFGWGGTPSKYVTSHRTTWELIMTRFIGRRINYRASLAALVVAASSFGLAITQAGAQEASGAHISEGQPYFDVDAEGAPARAFFQGLVEGTRINLLVHPEVSGTVSLKLNHVTLEQVLEAARDLYGYDYRRVATGYMVLPANVQTRIYQLNYLDLERLGVSKTRVSSGQITQGGESEYGEQSSGQQNGGSGGSKDNDRTEVTGTSVMTRSDSDFWGAIETNVRSIVGADTPDRSVVINRQSGVIVVRALPREHRDVKDYLDQTERTVTRQVVLEAKIVEVELSETYQAGINWTAILRDGNRQYALGQMTPPGGFDADLLSPSGTPVVVAPGNPISGFVNETLGGAFALAADMTDFNAYIELLKLQGRTRVLSSPRVSTLHNQKAIIKAGTDEFFVTGIESDTTTGTATTTTVDLELTPFFSGVALDVTPQISEDGRVLLHVHPTISDVTDQQKSLSVRGQTDVLPLALSQVRESDSIVKAYSGQVIVIGGLMRESRRRSDYKTPLLGDIPLAGRLFRSERDQTVTTELVIFLRPLVVADDGWQPLVDERNQRLEEVTKQGKLQP
jgi:MSHA biogenesis protein MshL